MASDPKNPHRGRMVTLDDLLVPERDPDADGRSRAARAKQSKVAEEVFADYAFTFSEEWPGRPIEYLQWSPSRIRTVLPWLNRSAVALNRMVGTVLAVPDYQAITPQVVLRLVVRHWRMFARYRLREYGAPVPEAIAMLCARHPNLMLDTLMGVCGQTVKLDLEAQSRAVLQMVNNVESTRMVEEKRAEIHATRRRLMDQVRWLEDDEFLDAISEERIGKRKRDVTMH